MSIKQAIKSIILPHGHREVTIRGGSLKGMRFMLDLQHNLQGWLGLYEKCLQHWLDRYTKPGAQCLDIGASDGCVTLHMAKLAGPSGFVWAFEPGDRFGLIGKNLELNSKLPLAKVKQFDAYVGAADAAAGADGKAILAIDPMVVSGTIARVDVVKIDVDGPEVEVLKGMKVTLERFHPNLFVEVHSRELLAQVEAITKPLGYNMKLEMPAKREMRPSEFNAFYFSETAG